MITVENLAYTYPGAIQETLHGLNFEIAEREIFGFLGPSGAGKSTTQKILIGLLKEYGGTIEVMNREVSAWGPDYYEHVGVSFELPNHYLKLTALENLNHFQSLYSGETLDPMEVLEWVGLKEDADKKVADYSKGMKIRLNVARSLLHKPKVLFLDEPTNGLDPVNARKIKDLVLELRSRGTTIFMTTHDMMVADELCDRVAFITAGHISVIDAPSALKKHYGKRAVRVEYDPHMLIVVSAWGPDYYEHVGVSFELPNHYLKLTALENLNHFQSLYSGETLDPMEVLEWVGLKEDADKKVADYSKGMKIRLNVARSLLHKPKVLFLDEPTNGLDPVNARKIKDLVLELRSRGTTIFMTTHDMMVADELCDRVAFITAGHISVIDAPSALKKHYGKRAVRVEYVNRTQEIQHQEFPLDGLGDNGAFINLLKSANRVETIHTQESTLENIFIEVTGEGLSV